MDKAIVERAVEALAALNGLDGSNSEPAREIRPAVVAQSAAQSGDCGVSHCAGCYEVGEGMKIHPPKCGESYCKWLENWKPNGKTQ